MPENTRNTLNTAAEIEVLSNYESAQSRFGTRVA